MWLKDKVQKQNTGSTTSSASSSSFRTQNLKDTYPLQPLSMLAKSTSTSNNGEFALKDYPSNTANGFNSLEYLFNYTYPVHGVPESESRTLDGPWVNGQYPEFIVTFSDYRGANGISFPSKAVLHFRGMRYEERSPEVVNGVEKEEIFRRLFTMTRTFVSEDGKQYVSTSEPGGEDFITASYSFYNPSYYTGLYTHPDGRQENFLCKKDSFFTSSDGSRAGEFTLDGNFTFAPSTDSEFIGTLDGEFNYTVRGRAWHTSREGFCPHFVYNNDASYSGNLKFNVTVPVVKDDILTLDSAYNQLGTDTERNTLDLDIKSTNPDREWELIITPVTVDEDPAPVPVVIKNKGNQKITFPQVPDVIDTYPNGTYELRLRYVDDWSLVNRDTATIVVINRDEPEPTPTPSETATPSPSSTPSPSPSGPPEEYTYSYTTGTGTEAQTYSIGFRCPEGSAPIHSGERIVSCTPTIIRESETKSEYLAFGTKVALNVDLTFDNCEDLE